jgi:hypothetical protein
MMTNGPIPMLEPSMPNTPSSHPAHSCRACLDFQTTESYCPECGIVSGSPLAVVHRSADEALGQAISVTHQLGGRRYYSRSERERIADPALRRAILLDGLGRLRTKRDEMNPRWQLFLRTSQPFDLTRSMNQDAMRALRQLRLVPGGTSGLSNVAIDGAVIFLVLRQHHRPIRTQRMATFLKDVGCHRSAFQRAVRFVKRNTGLGIRIQSYDESVWVADGRLPARFLCRLREKARLAQGEAKLSRLSPSVLVAGIAFGMAQREPIPGASESEICEIFSVTNDCLDRATKLVVDLGIVA